jgi:DNA (cytosine-5)-methyltransferase 1
LARFYKDGFEILIAQKNLYPRRLVTRKCGRLIGFPETFPITSSETRAYKCFGNSVVVPVVEVLAGAIVKSEMFAQKKLQKQITIHVEQSAILN